jgi:hypothetical protein
VSATTLRPCLPVADSAHFRQKRAAVGCAPKAEPESRADFSESTQAASCCRLLAMRLARSERELRAQVGNQLTSRRAVDQADLECPHRIFGEPVLEARDAGALIEHNADQVSQRDASQRLAFRAWVHAGLGGPEDRELGVTDREIAHSSEAGEIGDRAIRIRQASSPGRPRQPARADEDPDHLGEVRGCRSVHCGWASPADT